MNGETNERAETLLRELEVLETHLRAFADEAWQSVDYRDRAVREARIREIDRFVSLADRYQTLTADIASGIRALTSPVVVPAPSPGGAASTKARSRDPGTNNLDPTSAGHSLGENFSYAHPIAYRLQSRLIRLNAHEWREMYLAVWKDAMRHDRVCVAELARQGFLAGSNASPKPFVSTEGKRFTAAREVDTGIFVEANLSANETCKRIRWLFREVGISEKEMRIYLSFDPEPRQ